MPELQEPTTWTEEIATSEYQDPMTRTRKIKTIWQCVASGYIFGMFGQQVNNSHNQA